MSTNADDVSDADASTESVGMEPGSSEGEGFKTAHDTPSKGTTSSTKPEIKETNEQHESHEGDGILTSINPCCCFICTGCSFLLACMGIAIYTVVTSLVPFIVGIAWISIDSLPPETIIFRGGLPGVAGISGISFSQPGPKPSLSIGNPKFDIPCGIFGLLAGVILLGVCLHEKLKPDKSKVWTLILAILCWVSCVFLFIHFLLAYASIVKQRSAIKNAVETLSRPPHSGNRNTKQNNTKKGARQALFLFLILAILHSLLCIYFIFCVFILGFQILKKKNSDEENDAAPSGASSSSSQLNLKKSPANSSSHTRLIEGDEGPFFKLSLINPCCCCKCRWFKLSLVCFAIGIYAFLTSMAPLILGIGIYNLDAEQKAFLAHVGALDTMCGVFGLLTGLILLTVGLYDTVKADKSKLLNYIMAILCWISCIFIIVHFTLAFVSLYELYNLNPQADSDRIKSRTGPGLSTSKSRVSFFSREKSSELPLAVRRILIINDNHNAFLMLIVLHFVNCVYFLICICFLSFSFLQESKNAVAKVRPESE